MGFWSKITVVILAILAGLYIKASFFDGPDVEKKLVAEEQIIEEPSAPAEKREQKEKVKKAQFVTIYYLGVDNKDNSLFKKAKREVPDNARNLKFALEQLVSGPTDYEKKQGVFSEVPKSTKVLGVVEGKDKIIIDLSSDLVNGGGADSLYSRIKQVIKTALANSPDKPVFLYIDGKQADVIGGEGLMISQPLRETSLDE